MSSSESLYSMLELQMKDRGLLETEKKVDMRKALSKKTWPLSWRRRNQST